MPIGSENWIEEGMLFDAANLPGGDGFEFSFRNQFFHGSHPLGWIRRFQLDVDGTEVDPAGVSFTLRGQQLALHQLPDIADIWWRPLEVATVRVAGAGPLPAGRHSVTVILHVSSFFSIALLDKNGVYPTIRVRLHADLPVGERPLVSASDRKES